MVDKKEHNTVTFSILGRQGSGSEPAALLCQNMRNKKNLEMGRILISLSLVLLESTP